MALDKLQKFQIEGTELAISNQILREYLATVTRLNATGTALPLANILFNVQAFQTNFRLLEDNGVVFSNLVTLLQNVSMAGKQIHDANIVTTISKLIRFCYRAVARIVTQSEASIMLEPLLV